jgi:hypothetical protein
MSYEIDGLTIDQSPDKTFIALALDGPRNAEYLTVREAHDNGYELREWSGDLPELVWLHKTYIDPDLAEYIAGAVEDCELR